MGAAYEPQPGTGFPVFGRADDFLGHGIKKGDFNGESTQGEHIVGKTNRMIKNTQPFSLPNKGLGSPGSSRRHYAERHRPLIKKNVAETDCQLAEDGGGLAEKQKPEAWAGI